MNIANSNGAGVASNFPSSFSRNRNGMKPKSGFVEFVSQRFGTNSKTNKQRKPKKKKKGTGNEYKSINKTSKLT